MAELTIWSHSFEAAADLRNYANRFVKLSAARTVNVCGANEVGIGILKNAPDLDAAGKAATVALVGIAMLTVNGASPNIAAGDPLESIANGIGVKSTTDKHNVVCIANQAATADGVEIEVLLFGPRQGSV
jgi:Uncharacterized conserved protein (DUF2190)